MKSSAQIIALSGPSEGQAFPVDEDGIRLSDDCVVRLRDGRAVAYGRRDGQETPWCLHFRASQPALSHLRRSSAPETAAKLGTPRAGGGRGEEWRPTPVLRYPAGCPI